MPRRDKFDWIVDKVERILSSRMRYRTMRDEQGERMLIGLVVDQAIAAPMFEVTVDGAGVMVVFDIVPSS